MHVAPGNRYLLPFPAVCSLKIFLSVLRPGRSGLGEGTNHITECSLALWGGVSALPPLSNVLCDELLVHVAV